MRRFLSYCILLVSLAASGRVVLSAQSYPTVGLTLGKHVGSIQYKAISKTDSLIATVSEDRTLKIWKYPSGEFLRSINMPEMRGNSSRLGICCILNRRIVLVADDSGFDYEFKQQQWSIDRVAKVTYGKNGSIYPNLPENVTTDFCFYVIDWPNGAIVDRISVGPHCVLDFELSSDLSTVLVTTSGEKALLFDTASMRLISEMTFDDEEILAGRFLDHNELVLFTDLFYYRFRIRRYSNVHFAERELLDKRRVTNVFKRKMVNRVRFSEDNNYAYLFGGSRFLFSMNLYDGGKRRDLLPDGYHEETLLLSEPDSIITAVGGRVKTVPAKGAHKRAFSGMLRRINSSYSLDSDQEGSIPDSLFLYRSSPAPIVTRDAGRLYVRYAGQTGWEFSKDLLLTPLENDLSRPLEQQKQEVKSTVYFKAWTGERGDSISTAWIHTNLGIPGHLFYIDDDNEVPMLREWNRLHIHNVLPASVHRMYPWVNNRHFLISLEDGTLRWYNVETGEEELALFISKDGEWVIWSPDGKYDQSSTKAGNMLEWRYQTYSKIDTKKPKDNRKVYCRPNAIKEIVRQLYDENVSQIAVRRSTSLEDVVRIDAVQSDDDGNLVIRYRLSDYNPVVYGPYSIEVFIDDTRYSNPIHYPDKDGGILIIKTNPNFQIIELAVSTAKKGWLPPATHENALVINNLYVTCAGVGRFISSPGNNLLSPANDARDMADLLELNGVLPVLGRTEHTVLFDEKVSLASLISRIQELQDKVSKKDLAIFYFSGHGNKDEDGFSLMLSDGTNLHMNVVLNAIRDLACPVLIIIDACFSGELVDSASQRMAILTSSDAFTKSRDGQDVYSESLFTATLMDYIQHCLQLNDSLSLDEMVLYLASSPATGTLHPQFINNIGNIIIVK
ncbi:MAG: caspase family protein [Bacteroidales bacterium]|nr:caspase family protein [Bacteroidales bacterium]